MAGKEKAGESSYPIGLISAEKALEYLKVLAYRGSGYL